MCVCVFVCVCVCVCVYLLVDVCLCVRACRTECLAAADVPCFEERSVSLRVGLCEGINSLVRRAWLSPRAAPSNVFLPRLRRLLADEDVHMRG